MINDIFTNSVTVIMAIATLVSGITEMTKNIGFLKKVPTKLQVVILGIVLSAVYYAVIVLTTVASFGWYGVIKALCTGLIGGLTSIYGFDTVRSIYNRFVDKINAAETDEENK